MAIFTEVNFEIMVKIWQAISRILSDRLHMLNIVSVCPAISAEVRQLKIKLIDYERLSIKIA